MTREYDVQRRRALRWLRERVRTALSHMAGAVRAEARRNDVHLLFDPARVSQDQLRERKRGAGFEPA